MFKHPSNQNNTTKVVPIDDKMVQPNTIDLRLDFVLEIATGPFAITEKSKTHRYKEVLTADEDGFYTLEQGRCYEFIAKQMVHVGESEMALVLGRSTFNRNGVLILSSIYDSGFKDKVGATVYNMGGQTKVQTNTRFAHLILANAESWSTYNGSYGIQ